MRLLSVLHSPITSMHGHAPHDYAAHNTAWMHCSIDSVARVSCLQVANAHATHALVCTLADRGHHQHHKLLGTAEDHSTARKGENVWQFMARCVLHLQPLPCCGMMWLQAPHML